ncbi:LHFPL tetraspan subfamily member 3 protein, partial [Dissostichus eleginoides]
MSAPPPLADLSRLYQTEFVRSVRAVGALWAVCALCSAVLQLVVLLQPAWVRSGGGGEASGTLGLFQAPGTLSRHLDPYPGTWNRIQVPGTVSRHLDPYPVSSGSGGSLSLGRLDQRSEPQPLQ